MLSSSLYALLKLSKTTSPQKLFDYVCMIVPFVAPTNVDWTVQCTG